MCDIVVTNYPVLLASLVAFLALGPVALAAPTLTDASFEDPHLPNTGYGNGNNFLYQPTGSAWTYSSNAGVSATGGPFYAGNAPDGVQGAFLQSTASSGAATISQVVTGLVAGQSYSVMFYLAARPGYGTNPVSVTFGGINLGTFTNATASFIGESTARFVASATSALLVFTGTNTTGSDNDSAIDAVSVVSVPEPASLALLAVGMAATMRLRRRQKA